MEANLVVEWALNEAVKEAAKSKCQSQRGVVIWNERNGLMGSGHNRPPLPFICDGSDKCRANCGKTAVHAEQNALLDFTRRKHDIDLSECEMIHIKIIDGVAVPSKEPSCWQCSKLILEAGLRAMWLYQDEGLVRYTPTEFHKATMDNCGL